MEEKKLSPEDIKRVKGLGFLRDKRYPDVFNARVITRNGRITADEHRAIAEAADRFGSGQVAMTTRLTMEIQGVPYENIEPLTGFSERLGGLDDRRHRGTGAPGGFLQGNHLPVRPDRYLSPFPRKSTSGSMWAIITCPCPINSRLP